MLEARPIVIISCVVIVIVMTIIVGIVSVSVIVSIIVIITIRPSGSGSAHRAWKSADWNAQAMSSRPWSAYIYIYI